MTHYYDDAEAVRPRTPSVHSDGSYTEDFEPITVTVRVVYKRVGFPDLHRDFEQCDRPKGYRVGGMDSPGTRATIGGLRAWAVLWLTEILPEGPDLKNHHIHFHQCSACSDKELRNDYLPLCDLKAEPESAQPATIYMYVSVRNADGSDGKD